MIRRTNRIPISTWVSFSAMGLGVFMAILDIQVVATSLPKIREAIDIPPDRMSWIQTAYLIAEVISIPLTGWLDPCAHHTRPGRDRDRDLHHRIGVVGAKRGNYTAL